MHLCKELPTATETEQAYKLGKKQQPRRREHVFKRTALRVKQFQNNRSRHDFLAFLLDPFFAEDEGPDDPLFFFPKDFLRPSFGVFAPPPVSSPTPSPSPPPPLALTSSSSNLYESSISPGGSGKGGWGEIHRLNSCGGRARTSIPTASLCCIFWGSKSRDGRLGGRG